MIPGLTSYQLSRLGLNPFGEEEDGMVMPLSPLTGRMMPTSIGPAGGMPAVASQAGQAVAEPSTVPSMPQMTIPAAEDPIQQAMEVRRRVIAGARQGIDPRIEAILARREQRLAEQEGQIRERPTIGDTLLNIASGMAGAGSSRLSAAITAGLVNDLQARRAMQAEALRQRAALEKGREDITMERIRQEGAGRKDALEEFNATIALAKDMGGIRGTQLENRAKAIVTQFAPERQAAELLKARSDATKAAVDAQFAPQVARAELAKTQAETVRALREPSGGAGGGAGTAFERRAEEILRAYGEDAYNEFIATGKYLPPGADLTQTQRGTIRQKLSGLQNIENQIKRLEDIERKGVAFTGPVAGYIPGSLSGSANTYDKALANLRSLVRQVTRTPGEGAMSDFETRLANAILPERTDTPEGRAEALAGLRQLSTTLRSGYSEMLGGARTARPSSGGSRTDTSNTGWGKAKVVR